MLHNNKAKKSRAGCDKQMLQAVFDTNTDAEQSCGQDKQHKHKE
jgi:hypothetical protein